jgi:hypothetical protein
MDCDCACTQPNHLLICRALSIWQNRQGRSSDTFVVSLYSEEYCHYPFSTFPTDSRPSSFSMVPNPTVISRAHPRLGAVLHQQGRVLNDTIAIVSNDPLSPTSHSVDGQPYHCTSSSRSNLYSDESDPVVWLRQHEQWLATAIGQTGYAPIVSMAVHPQPRSSACCHGTPAVRWSD